MQKLFLKFSGVAVLLTLLIATGCEDDTVDPINQLPPAVSLVDGVGLTSTDAILAPGETFTVNVEILTGDNPIETFTFLVDGTAIPNTDISNYYAGGEFAVDGSVETANNPVTLFGDAKQGALIAIEVVPFDQVDEEVKTYTFEAVDEAGNRGTASLDITIEDPSTPLDATLSGVLFNQAGPAGTGGLDLDTGESTASSADDAEIQDEGIDLDVIAANNWRKQISSANDAEMRAADLSALPENFSFDNVASKEEVQAVFDTGMDLMGSDEVCNCTDGTSGEEVTEILSGGEVFAVKRGDNYYLIRIDEVKETMVGNDDSYELSIKY